jgi:hypothetical protein
MKWGKVEKSVDNFTKSLTVLKVTDVLRPVTASLRARMASVNDLKRSDHVSW